MYKNKKIYKNNYSSFFFKNKIVFAQIIILFKLIEMKFILNKKFFY